MCLLTGTVATVAGAASGFFGIGGGFLIVPALIFATGMPMINAIGSSCVAVGVFGLATALNYAGSGFGRLGSGGRLHRRRCFRGIVGMLAATRLSKYKTALTKVFAGLIFAVRFYILYRSVGD